MSDDLIKYNAAKRALAEAVRIDEVKDIRDKATAMRVYAMQAKDRVLIDQATEIRLRAERRAGELLKDMEKNKGARGNPRGRGAKIVRSQDETTQPTLSELGINKSQASKWQKLADRSEDDFEEMVANAKQKACAAVDRAHQPKPEPKPKPKRKQPAKGDFSDIVAACVSEVEAIVRSTVSKIDVEARLGLFEQLDEAIGMIKVDAAVREAKANGQTPIDADRWIEH